MGFKSIIYGLSIKRNRMFGSEKRALKKRYAHGFKEALAEKMGLTENQKGILTQPVGYPSN